MLSSPTSGTTIHLPSATSPPTTLLDLGALFTQCCAATTHVLLRSKAMWQICKSMYVSGCWKRALTLLAAKLTLLLSSERGPLHSSVPQTQTLPGSLPLRCRAASLQLHPRHSLHQGNASASMLRETKLPAPGSSHSLRSGFTLPRAPVLVLGLILAGEERFYTRREAEQREIARLKCSTLAKMVSKY